ncbi:hypothetical protein [Paraliomyxa miuraensis]|uniref:hypothetical protein n=1 Tax=Paraliomyxa miuraensis TaxID=376150 RepID=UPI0022549377|nr:hypothetical protein [Paraliomyxa miuraensis]MCX4246322.1 hypothetical protein [Paraliomyxa miuraensis]
MPTRRPRLRPSLPATILAVLGTFALLGSAPAEAKKKKPDGPYSTGDLEHGELFLPLYRGATVPFELSVIATPDCSAPLDMTLSWDADDDELTVEIKGKGALEPHPNLYRTAGVDFFPNQFNPQVEDVIDGRYQLWLISASGPMLMFYYDPVTLDLLGSEYDFEVPPPAIAISFPTLYLVPTPFFQPDEDGDVDETFTYSYEAMTRGDRPDLAHFYITFPPHNLCFANPDRLDLSTLRPYLTDPRPADEARPWSDWLRGTMLFDVTVEPPEYHTEPPRVTFMGSHQNSTAVGGGLPDGWKLDLDAALMGVAPPIRPWQGAGLCEQTFEPMHAPGINFCL